MADYPRSAKFGNSWSRNDLRAYNISIVPQDSVTFFGKAVLPLPAHHRDLFEKVTAEEMEGLDSYRVARYMYLATYRIPEEESAVIDFMMQLLLTMGYVERESGRDLRSRKNIPFFICGEYKHATADVCVMDGHQFLLIVQEDRRHLDQWDAHPELIAKAIAAVQYNDKERRELGLEPLDCMEMAGIVMIGTSPAFFRIPVTRQLLQAVECGEYPSLPTIVSMHLPDLPRPDRRFIEGMQPIDNRPGILACFEAFKQFLTDDPYSGKVIGA